MTEHDGNSKTHFLFRTNAVGGGHVHVKLHAGDPKDLQVRGGFVIPEEEWAALKRVLAAPAVGVVVTFEGRE